MSRVASRMRTAATLLREGRYADVVSGLGRVVWSEKRFIGLCRDLSKPRPPLPSPVKFEVRPLRESDVPDLLGDPANGQDIGERVLRRSWLDRGLQGCYVAATNGGPVCFMQWLLTAASKKKISEIFGDSLPQLDAETVLLEGAYTPPAYRRIPIMPAAMDRIADVGRALGARRAIVYIGEDNASMIKAAQWAGFVPHEERRDRRRFFLSAVTYSPLEKAS
jgi:hypothetical protein